MQGFDADGEPTASSGDPSHPFEVPIRSEIVAEAPHLPNRAAPQSCDKDAASTAEGAAPAESAAPAEGGVEGSEESARALRAPGGPAPFARWWIGIAGAIDFLSLPQGDNLCALNAGAPANASGYYCTNPDGSDFPNRTSPQTGDLVPGQAGQVGGGLRPGDLRALVAVDYALSPEFLIGARVGYVLNAYPSGGAAVTDHRAFGPRLHLEARGTYVFGDAPLTRVGFAPAVFVAAGLAEFDGHATSIVSYVPLKPSSSTMPVNQPVNVWLTNGPWFLAAGGGARYQFSARAAFNAAVRLNVAFGGLGALFTFGPEIAFQYGF